MVHCMGDLIANYRLVFRKKQLLKSGNFIVCPLKLFVLILKRHVKEPKRLVMMQSYRMFCSPEGCKLALTKALQSILRSSLV